MTYKLNPELENIKFPAVLIMPDGERREYENGMEAAKAVFEQRYVIASIRTVIGTIKVTLIAQAMPNIN